MNKNFLTIIINSLVLAVLLVGIFYFLFVKFVKTIPDLPLPPELAEFNKKAIFFKEYTGFDGWLNKIINEDINASGISFKLFYDDKDFFAIHSNELGRNALFTKKNVQPSPSLLSTSSPSDNLPTTTPATTTSTVTSTLATTSVTSTKITTTTIATSSKNNATKK